MFYKLKWILDKLEILFVQQDSETKTKRYLVELQEQDSMPLGFDIFLRIREFYSSKS